MTNAESVFSVCGMCPEHCPIEVELLHSQPWWVHGNRKAQQRGALCALGTAGLGLGRGAVGPTVPLIREGSRGSGMWRSAKWDEALELTAKRLKKTLDANGPASLAWVGWDGPFMDLPRALLRGLGSTRFHLQHGLAWNGRNQASLETTGLPASDWICDYSQSRHVVFQGRDVLEPLSLDEANAVLDALNAGCRITAVDVRATQIACKAHEFLMIKPGSDYALNLAVLHVLLFERLFNADFVRTHLANTNELAQFVRDHTPEWAGDETGIPAQSIRALARDLAAAAPAVIWHPGKIGGSRAEAYGVARSAYLINGLLGSYGAPGGLVRANGPGDLGRKDLRRLSNLYPVSNGHGRSRKKGPAVDDHCGPGAAFLDSAKAILAHRDVPALSRATGKDLESRLGALDFIACITTTWSDVAWNADVVLPEAGYLANSSILATRKGLVPQFFLQNEAARPTSESRPLWSIICALAGKLGLDKLAFQSIEDVRSWQLTGTKFKLSDFWEKGFVDLAARPSRNSPFPLPTPGGGVQVLRDNQEPLPDFEPADQGLRLFMPRLGWRELGHCLATAPKEPGPALGKVWINEDAAKDLGIAQGNQVIVSGGGYSVSGTAQVSSCIHPLAVFFSPGQGCWPPHLNGDGKNSQRHLADWLEGFIPEQPGSGSSIKLSRIIS